MEFIQVPLPEFGFDEIAKEKAKFIMQYILHTNSLMQYFNGGNTELELRLQNEIFKLFENYERLICIVELLNFLIAEEKKLQTNISFTSRNPTDISMGFNKIRYVLYSLAKTTSGYTFDKNAFTREEVDILNIKINDILSALTRLEVGQEVLYNEFDDVKAHISNEFEALKTSFPLGKKIFYQLTFGKIASSIGNKVAEDIFKKLEPHIIDLLKLIAPDLVEGFQKLIG